VIGPEKEYASDMLLVQLVELRLISEKTMDALGSTELGRFEESLAMFYLKSLEGLLFNFRCNVPSECLDNSKSFLGSFKRRLKCTFMASRSLSALLILYKRNSTNETLQYRARHP